MSVPARSSTMTMVLLLVSLAWAGCLAADDVDPSADAAVPLDPESLLDLVVLDHDHTDRAAHAGNHDLRLAGWTPGVLSNDPTNVSATGINEVAIWGDFAYLSRAGAASGIAVVDLSDPAAPRVVGAHDALPAVDVEVTDDGVYAFLAVQRNPITVPSQSTLETPPRGIQVFDVSDPTNPTPAGYFPMPYNGVHTIEYVRDTQTNRELLSVQTYDLTSSVVPGTPAGNAPVALPFGALGATQRITLLELERGTDGPSFDVLGMYQVQNPDPDPTGPDLYIPHDAHIERHPITGELLLYVAYWDAGLRIVNIDDPAMPQEIATWTDFSPSSLKALHDVKTAPTLIEGRHITMTAPEIVSADEVGQFTLFDTTDPRAPKKLGHWTLPGEGLLVPSDAPFLLSPHNFYIHPAGLVTLAHNHGGAWVLDIGTEERLMEPRAVAYAMPTEGLADAAVNAPSVWTSIWFGDRLLATDTGTGLYVYEPSGFLSELLAERTADET